MTSLQLDEERIFHVARGIADPGLRGEYLEQICAGDPNLRERVQTLLDVQENVHSHVFPSQTFGNQLRAGEVHVHPR